MTLMVSSCKKDAAVVPQETPVDKRIEFNVFTQHDYSNAVYNTALAEVRLSISKTNLKTSTTGIVWDTVFSFRQFRQYPRANQMIKLGKNVRHYENSETLDVSSVVRFNHNGYMSMEAKNDPVLQSETYKLAVVTF